MATPMIYMAPLVKWHNCYDILTLNQNMLMKLRNSARNSYKLILVFFFFLHFFATLRYAIDTSFYDELMWVFFYLAIGLCMPKALIYVAVVTNKCIDRLWETDIMWNSWALDCYYTFRSTGIDTILYWEYVTLPYRTIFLFTLIHMLQRIMGIEWIMISFPS